MNDAASRLRARPAPSQAMIDRMHLPSATLSPEPFAARAISGPALTGASSIHRSTGPENRCRLEVRCTERDTFTEFHLTATVLGPCDALDACRAILDLLADEITEKGIQPLQEKFYGRSAIRADVLRIRDAIYRQHDLDTSVPPTWLQGLPLHGCDLVGVQVWGIAPRGGWSCVTTVEAGHGGRARLWTGRGFRMLHIPSVRGTHPDGRLPTSDSDQAELMFRNATSILAAQGFGYRHVKRTWIYVRRLLEWYDELNRVRSAFYATEGLEIGGGHAFPASTGIQCSCDGEEIMMDVLAFDTEGPQSATAVPLTTSSRQHQSFNYGSAFSRGMVFDIEGRRTIHVSGTASINAAGASIHVGDAEMQSLETLLCIAALLETQGGTLEHITSATLFCKDRHAYEAWQRVTRLLRVPHLPMISVIADVCRDDLLVEMEAVATI